jgi:aminopeptidase N
MDQAAVPDFFFGAMENFGLNIYRWVCLLTCKVSKLIRIFSYRESALLIFEDDTTETERLSVSEVLAHELAHQWFGNLVTAAFWTHIWLNEG